MSDEAGTLERGLGWLGASRRWAVGAALLTGLAVWIASRVAIWYFDLATSTDKADLLGVVEGLGLAALTGVFAGGFLKALQISGFVKEELMRVLAEKDASALKKCDVEAIVTKGLHSVWDQDPTREQWIGATRGLVANCCQRASEHATDVLKHYVGYGDAKVGEASYSHVSCDFEIAWKDKNAGTIAVRDTFINHVHSNVAERPIDIYYKWTGTQADTLEIESLSFSREPRGEEVDQIEQVTSSATPTTRTLEYKLTLSGAAEYKLSRGMARVCSLRSSEPYVRCQFDRIATDLTITVKCSEPDLSVAVVELGVLNPFTKTGFDGRRVYRYASFLPKQGFMLVFSQVSPGGSRFSSSNPPTSKV